MWEENEAVLIVVMKVKAGPSCGPIETSLTLERIC